MAGQEFVRRLVSRLHAGHLLPAGAVLGLVLAALGAFSSSPEPPMDDVAALVNGIPIRKADHERVIEALAASKRNPLDTEDRSHALTRLVDEELLIQRGLELGLHRTDPMTRKRLVAAMLDWIAADAEGNPPTEEDLQTFYRENLPLFTPAARIDVDWFRIARSAPGGKARAGRLGRELAAGKSFEEASAAASPSALALPEGMLPPAKLQDYLGPTLTRHALSLEPDTPAGPFARTDGWHFLIVRERENAAPPAFEEIRDEVAAEYERRRADDAIRDYLAWLRRRADIVTAGDQPR